MTTPSFTQRSISTAKERRRQAKLAELVKRWWCALPLADRRAYYTAPQIEAGTGAPIHIIGSALRAAGWNRARVTHRGKTLSVWIAPGAARPDIRPGRDAAAPRNEKGQYV